MIDHEDYLSCLYWVVAVVGFFVEIAVVVAVVVVVVVVVVVDYQQQLRKEGLEIENVDWRTGVNWYYHWCYLKLEFKNYNKLNIWRRVKITKKIVTICCCICIHRLLLIIPTIIAIIVAVVTVTVTVTVIIIIIIIVPLI